MPLTADPMDGHQCQCIAEVFPLGDGRKVWVGELLEPIEGFPTETHCLHVQTPAKSVVFGINAADVAALAVVCQIIHGMPINQRWLDIMENAYRKRGRHDYHAAT